mgnify:CR=1 FL=1
MTALLQFQDFMFKGIPQSWQPKPEPPLDPPESVDLDAPAYGEQSERELRDTLTKFSDPDFFLDVDWNYDDVELSIDGKWVIVKQVVTTRIPFGALYK